MNGSVLQDLDVYEMFSGCGELGNQCRNFQEYGSQFALRDGPNLHDILT